MPRDVQLSFPPSEAPPALDERELHRLAAKKLRVAADGLIAVRARRISFDARPRHRRWQMLLSAWERGEEVPPVPSSTPPTFERPRDDAPHVVVIGSGPAGLFGALDLLAAGVRVTVVERGRDVRTRRRALQHLNRGGAADGDSNYCFGEGGAGTYSDGKLYTRSGNKAQIRFVLETLVAHGAPEDILVSWRPHVGSNRLPDVVRAMRETLLRSGGAIRFATRAESFETEERQVSAVICRDVDSGTSERIQADACILATGHSALDSIRMARAAGAELEAKGFAMGVRIEHPQSFVDERQYGGLRSTHDLPAAFYELSTNVRERGVYSFCMCPGGFVVPASTAPDRVVVNGMSLSRRDSPFANSGLVVALEPEDWCGERGRAEGWVELLERAAALGVDVPVELPNEPGDDPLFGVRLQHALESVAAHAGGGANRAPVQRADCVAEDRGRRAEPLPTSYRPGLTAVDLRTVFPAGLFDRLREGLVELDRTLPGFASELGQLIGVESRTSSPVRIVRDEKTLMSPTLAGLYPAGEGAGFAGGIVSAALDGRRVAAALAERLARSQASDMKKPR